MSDFEISADGRLCEYSGDEQRVEIPCQVSRIGHRAFKNKEHLKEVVINKSVTKIDSESFYNCPLLKEIYIPEGVEKIEDSFAMGCDGLKEITVTQNNKEYKSINGVAYTKNINELLLYPPARQDKTFEIPSEVAKISAFAFANAINLEKIIIGKSVCEIDEGAFDNCTSLNTISVSPDNEYYLSINGSLYTEDKTKLVKYTDKQGKDLVIEQDTRIIGEHACVGCDNLESVTLPSGLREIEGCAFFDCPNLKEVEIQEGVTTIGYSAFCKCKALERVTLPSTLKEIIAFAFSDCPSLEEIEIPKSVELIDFGAFHNSPTTLLVKEDSYAHKYAIKKDLKYILI